MRVSSFEVSILGIPLASVIPEAAQRLSGIHNHSSFRIARVAFMDSGLAPAARPGMSSHPLDNRRRSHAGADAERHQRGGKIAPFEFVEDGAEDHRAGRAE